MNTNIILGLYVPLSLPVTVYSRTSQHPFILLKFVNDPEFVVEPFLEGKMLPLNK